jgi:hypothetical protein
MISAESFDIVIGKSNIKIILMFLDALETQIEFTNQEGNYFKDY